MKFKRTSAAIALAASAATVVVAAGPASAAESCPAGQVCLYYNSNELGSYEHWSTPGEYDLEYYTFSNWGNGSGYGQTVYNNAASVTNNTGHTIYIASSVNGQWYGIGAGFSGTLPQNPPLYNKDWLLEL